MTAQAETTPLNPLVVLGQRLDARTNELKAALPDHIAPDRFIRVIKTAAQINPDLVACEWLSLWNACMRAANDGLLPDGVEGAIVPYKSKATWIPMYQGLLKKFRNSGEFKWITAGIVYEGEAFHHYIDETGEHFYHQPKGGDKILRVYAIATTKEGGIFVADMSPKDVDKRKNMSRASREDAPWKIWPEEMMKKTALRQLSKLLPKSSDLDAMMRRDEEALYDNVEQGREEARPTVVRPVGNALDVFGAETPDTLGERQENEASSGGAVQVESNAQDRPADESEDRPEPLTGTIDAAEMKAFERGKQDRAKGVQRRAVPGDLRENNKLAIAWTRGWEAAKDST